MNPVLKRIALLLLFFLIINFDVNSEKIISLKLTGIPDKLEFPLPEGSNIILTVEILGGNAIDVWLALSETSSGRIFLSKTDKKLYQINLASKEIAALLGSSDSKQFQVFAETKNKKVYSSLPVHFTIKKRSFQEPSSVKVVVNNVAATEELDNYWRSESWNNTDSVTSIVIEYIPYEAEINATASFGKDYILFDKLQDREGVLQLNINDSIRKKWREAGTLSISWSGKDKPLILKAIPKNMVPFEIPAVLTVIQRYSERLPGAGGYLMIKLGDISGGEVLTSIVTADNNIFIKKQPLRKGGFIDFEYGREKYRIVLVSLINLFSGDDYAVFLFSPLNLNDSQKISYLLKLFEISKSVIIKEEKEYSGTAAIDLVKKETGIKDGIEISVEEFISKITALSNHNTSLNIKEPNGEIINPTCKKRSKKGQNNAVIGQSARAKRLINR
jgi:hypothetical protein